MAQPVIDQPTPRCVNGFIEPPGDYYERCEETSADDSPKQEEKISPAVTDDYRGVFLGGGGVISSIRGIQFGGAVESGYCIQTGQKSCLGLSGDLEMTIGEGQGKDVRFIGNTIILNDYEYHITPAVKVDFRYGNKIQIISQLAFGMSIIRRQDSVINLDDFVDPIREVRIGGYRPRFRAGLGFMGRPKEWFVLGIKGGLDHMFDADDGTGVYGLAIFDFLL